MNSRLIYLCNVHESLSEVFFKFFNGNCPSSPVVCDRPGKRKKNKSNINFNEKKFSLLRKEKEKQRKKFVFDRFVVEIVYLD